MNTDAALKIVESCTGHVELITGFKEPYRHIITTAVKTHSSEFYETLGYLLDFGTTEERKLITQAIKPLRMKQDGELTIYY